MTTRLLWLEDTLWGVLGGCGRCGYSAGPWLDDDAMREHIADHWRAQHGAHGGIVPVAAWLEQECDYDGCDRAPLPRGRYCERCRKRVERAA